MFVVTIVVFITITYFLGGYAYNNPDPNKCWVVRDLHTAGKSKADVIARSTAMGIDVTDGYPMEMHQVYVLWFLWGFWAKVVFVGLFAIIVPAGYFAPKMGQVLGGLTCASYLINGGIWLAFGAIWRFSKAGIVASADKLERPQNISDDAWRGSLDQSAEVNGY